MLKSKTGLAMAGTYLALVLIAALYALYRLNFAPADSEFSGLPLILLTLPWSMMIFSWLGTYVPNSLTATFSILLFSGLLNTTILYFIGAALASLFKARLK